jgi:hypothetical protein
MIVSWYNAIKVVKLILYVILLWDVTYILISTEHAKAESRFFRNVGSIYQNTRRHIAEDTKLHLPGREEIKPYNFLI